MNKKQKIVLAIFIPIIIFCIALMIANSVGVLQLIRQALNTTQQLQVGNLVKRSTILG